MLSITYKYKYNILTITIKGSGLIPTIYATITEKAHDNFSHFKVNNHCNTHEGVNMIMLSLDDENVISEVNRYIRENIK